MSNRKRCISFLSWMAVAVVASRTTTAAAENAPADGGDAVDYSHPAVLTGTVYAHEAVPKDILYKFRRTATRSNDTVRVLREFTHPDGRIAAREEVVYENGRLVSCNLEEPPIGSHCSARVQPNPRNPRERVMSFESVYNREGGKKNNVEPFQKDILNNDMIGLFIAAHWKELNAGASIRFRFTALARAETIGFTLTRESESTWHGKPVVLIKMEATSWFVGQFVDPLHFTVEKDPPHRVFQYFGRTTPSVQRGEKWVDLDALTVFDWK